VLELCKATVDQREAYIDELLQGLITLRRNKFRPHWLVFEEAQHYLSSTDTALTQALLRMLPDGGWAIVTYRPDWLPETILAGLDRCIISSLKEPEPARVVHEAFQIPTDISLADIPPEHVLLCGQKMVHVRPSSRRVQHIRHVYKYLDMPLPRHKRFYFATSHGSLGIEATSLADFIHILAELPLESLVFHHSRGDFSAWAASSLGDDVLAAQLDKLTRRSLQGDALREAILNRASARYGEISLLAR
jgi:hypothetical protein